MGENNKRDYSLAYAYALEEAYKKDNQGFDTVEAFAAHTIGKFITEALMGKANTFNMLADNPTYKEAFFGCKSAIEFMLWNIESPIMLHSGLDDSFADSFGELIDNNAESIVNNHPEIMEDDNESFYFT